MTAKQKPVESALQAVPETFEQAFSDLERIVASLESGEMSLEDSLAAYERGVVLARACQSQLQAAEQQVKVLEQDLLRPFNESADQEGPT